MSATSGLLQLLRILTPYEVVRLTTDLQERKKRHEAPRAENLVSVAIQENTVTENIQDNQAKILAFNEVVVTQEQQATQEAARAVQKEDKFLSKLGLKKKTRKPKVVGGDYEEDLDDDDVPKVKEEQISTTIFLLQEKEKIRKSHLKLVGQDALKNYRTQAAVDTTHEDKEDLSQSSSSGILVNKRQF